MKPTQRRRYAERIDRVIQYIAAEQGNEDATNLSALASVAGMSEYHFHRVFRLMTGETVGEAVSRIRLSRTLPVLAQGTTVIRAVGASGYGSQQSLTRAMRGRTGATPSELRADGKELERVAAMLRVPSRKTEAGRPLRIEVTSLEPFRLLAIRNIGDYAELNSAYVRLFELTLGQLPLEALQGIYGVPHDDPRFVPAARCRFDCALSVGAKGVASAPLQELELGGGEYLRLGHEGAYDRLHERIDKVYAAAICDQDREIGRAPLFIHYLDDPEEVAEQDLRSDVYLPLS